MAIFQKRSPDNPLAALQPPAPQRLPQPITPPSAPPQFLRDTEVRTQIGADAVINGKLAFTTPTRVEGKLTAKVSARLLVVRDGGFFEGECAVGPNSPVLRDEPGTGTSKD